MDRQDCEKIIIEKMKDIVAIYHEYNPDGEYLSLCYRKDDDGIDQVSFNNASWEDDKEKPIRVMDWVSWPC